MTGPEREETDANMRSRVGHGSPRNTRGARASKAEAGPRGYIQRRVEQINKASQEGAEAGAGSGELWKRGRQGSGGHS